MDKRHHPDSNISKRSDNQEELDPVNDKLEFLITTMSEDLEFTIYRREKNYSENREKCT